jgi:hypothetical protein
MTLAFTPTTWAEQVLQDVNADDPSAAPVPIDANTVGDIDHWMPAEEPIGNWFDRDNPLNASLGTTSSDGTASYPDLATGADYTAKMIDQTNMSGIRQALATDQPVAGFSPAVVASPWASGHYGYNPQAIAQTTAGGGPAPAGSGTPGQLPAVTGVNGSPAGGTSATDTGVISSILGGATGAVWGEIEPFLVKSFLILGGMGILILAAYKAASPDIKSAEQSVGQAAAVAA